MTTEQKPLYAGRNPRQLEPHYAAHMVAMTREGLYEKSDIACELAWRDQQIATLRAQVEALSKPDAALMQACDLLSTTVGLVIAHQRRMGYEDDSAIDNHVSDVVQFLRPWPGRSPQALRRPASEITEQVIRDVCELEPANPDLNDTLCVDVSDLKIIMDRAASCQPPSLTRPAVPVGWRTGLPDWTDDDSIRVIAVTADDDFAGVQFHDIRASDFHLQDEDGVVIGTEVTQVCTHWIYRDGICPIAAAPQPEPAEPLARFCPGCGRVGSVDPKFRDCCPDGNKARLIPQRLAEHCHDLFRAALWPWIDVTKDTMLAIRTRALDEFGTGQAQGELWDQILMRETARTIQAAAKGDAW